jgi:oligosaccharyltransferase complex subunit alpha (ribophorin I)
MATPPPLRRVAALLLLLVAAASTPTARADLVVTRADRKVDLTSHIVRVLTSLKVHAVVVAVFSRILFV